MKPLLSAEEIKELERKVPTPDQWEEKPSHEYWARKRILEAHLRAVKAWGEEECPHSRTIHPVTKKEFSIYRRRECPQCWQELGL